MSSVFSRAVALLVATAALAAPAAGQLGPGQRAEALTSQEQPIRISIQPTYQQFDDGALTLREWSVPLQATIPLGDRWQLSVRGSGASAGGERLTTVTGLSDVQTTLSSAWQLGEGSLILTANVSAPTGKEELSTPEFQTVRLLSRNIYPVRVPSFGQGLAAGGGATWAHPVTDGVAVGVGASFRYRGPFDPVVGLAGEYDPGEETRLTGGVDVRLSRTSSLSGDLSLFLYGTDTVGGVERFAVGNQLAGRLQFADRRQDQRVIVTARYAGQEKSTLPVVQGQDVTTQALPSQASLRGRYVREAGEIATLEAFAAGRWYGETAALSSKTVVTVGLEPQVEVTESVSITARGAYTTGSFTALEGGVGLLVSQ